VRTPSRALREVGEGRDGHPRRDALEPFGDCRRASRVVRREEEVPGVLREVPLVPRELLLEYGSPFMPKVDFNEDRGRASSGHFWPNGIDPPVVPGRGRRTCQNEPFS
jgi:hypothetical protein